MLNIPNFKMISFADGVTKPILAVQNTVPPQQMPLAMALTIFSQSLGASVLLSIAEVIFSNSFRTLLTKDAPSVDGTRVVEAGATAFRKFVSGSDLAGVLLAYADSIDRVFYMAAAMAAGCFVFSFGMGWKSLKRSRPRLSKA